MENKQRSVFERIDSVESKIDSQSIKIDSLNEKIDELFKATIDANKKASENKLGDNSKHEGNTLDKRNVVSNFIRTSKREYLWFGTTSNFKKNKALLCVVLLALISIEILATIFTTMSIKFYSAFTLFENIWLIFTILTTTYSFNFKKTMSDIDLKQHSCEKFLQDRDGTWRIHSIKKTFLWFRRISNISCIANIIIIWTINRGTLSIISTVFEASVLIMTLASLFAYSNLFCLYGNIILYTNKGIDNKSTTLVLDVIGKKLITLEEFKKNNPILLN